MITKGGNSFKRTKTVDFCSFGANLASNFCLLTKRQADQKTGK